MMIFCYKLKGYDDFYKVEGSVRRSKSGFRVLTVENVTEISKRDYYKTGQPRFSLPLCCKEGDEIHELGNSFLPWDQKED